MKVCLKILQTANKMVVHVFRVECAILILCRQAQYAAETFPDKLASRGHKKD